jgi:hypothetical protein
MQEVSDSGQLVKVFVQLKADAADKQTEHWWAEAESRWAFPIGGDSYELRNIPWETDALHHRDIVRCRSSEDGRLQVVEVVERGGHATLRVTFADGIAADRRDDAVQRLEGLVGFSEKVSDRHWAFDVNPRGDVDAARAVVSELVSNGILVDSAVT